MDDGAALHGLRIGGLRHLEEIAEDDGMAGEEAAIDTEGGVAGEEDDVAVIEPEVGVAFDGAVEADGGEVGGEGAGGMVGDVDAPAFDDAGGGHQVAVGAGAGAGA